MIHSGLVRTLLIGQFVSVLMVCFNHLPLSLLKISPPIFSDTVYRQPALWGISFLFLSAGFLAHWFREQSMPSSLSWLSGTANYLTRRFIFLALPCYAAYLFDANILAFRDYGPSPNLTKVAPALATLSQTWIYNTAGRTSIGLPLTGSNMAWLGSCLFFLAITYALTRRYWARMGGKEALIVLGVATMLQAAQAWALNTFEAKVLAYGVARYGTLADGYSLYAYFYEYSPYAHLTTFIAGIALAQALQKGALDGTWPPAYVAGLGIALGLFGYDVSTRYLGLNIIILTMFALRPGAEAPTPQQTRRKGFRGRLADWLPNLAEASYTIWTLHLVMLLPFVSGPVDYSSWIGKLYLLCRVLVIMSMLLMLCVGFDRLIITPAREKILTRLGVGGRDVRFI